MSENVFYLSWTLNIFYMLKSYKSKSWAKGMHMALKPFDVCSQILALKRSYLPAAICEGTCSPHPCQGEPLGIPSAIFMRPLP